MRFSLNSGQLKSVLTTVSLLVFSVFGLIYYYYQSEYSEKLDVFKKNEREKVFVLSKILEDKFDHAYREIRTIAKLPGISSLNYQNNTQLPDVTNKAIQEIYNNIFELIRISELYIVPADFDPNHKNNSLGHFNKPILTFDEYISNSTTKKDTAPKDLLNLKEIEDFEYIAMKEQIDYFKSNFAELNTIKGSEYPMLISQELITCDNSNMDNNNINDKNRMGFVLSVPFYDHNHRFAGIISGVILSSVINNFLDNEDNLNRFTLLNNNNQFIAGNNILNNNKDNARAPNTIIEEILTFKESINLHDSKGEWKLVSSVSESIFQETETVLNLNQKYIFISVIFSGLSLFLFFYVLNTHKLNHWNELKKVELKNALDQRTEELDEASKNLIQATKLTALGELAASIAHEINNPIAVIQSKSERIINTLTRLQDSSFHLESKPNSKSMPSVNSNTDNARQTNSISNPDSQESYINELKIIQESSNKIIQMTERINKLVSGLRKFAHKGDNDPFVSVYLNKIINDTITLVEHKLKRHKVILKIDSIPDVQIFCRPNQIEQVLVNLINNATDAIENLSEKWILIQFKTDYENSIQITVTDSGNGIPAELQDRIMNPFFTTKEIGKGTGLGLSISQGIIKEHSGQLNYIADNPNTQFQIHLPLKSIGTKIKNIA